MERDGQIDLLTELLSLSTMTLATTGAAGLPHASPVYFAAQPTSTTIIPGEALYFYFFSDPQSQHGQDLALAQCAAAAIYPECSGWQDIRGLQMRGRVLLVEDRMEWDSAWQAYLHKFPFVSGMKDIVALNRLYAFLPDWIRLVDNRQGFGFKQEWEFK